MQLNRLNGKEISNPMAHSTLNIFSLVRRVIYVAADRVYNFPKDMSELGTESSFRNMFMQSGKLGIKGYSLLSCDLIGRYLYTELKNSDESRTLTVYDLTASKGLPLVCPKNLGSAVKAAANDGDKDEFDDQMAML